MFHIKNYFKDSIGVVILIILGTLGSFAQPLVANAGADQIICFGAAVTIGGSPTATYGSPGYSYSWLPSAGLSATNVANPSASPASTTTYTITVTDAVFSTSVDYVLVTVNPLPNATPTPSSSTICSGNNAIISLNADIAGSSFTWTVVQSGVTGAFPGSGALINQTLSTTAAVAGTATYNITPTAPSSCVGPTISVVVTVNPVPVYTGAGSATICSGSPLSLPFTSNIPSTYTWSAVDNTNTTGESLTTQTTSTLNNTITSTAPVTTNVSYTVQPTAISGGCAGNFNPVTVTVNSLPVANATPLTQTICSGSVATISLGSSIAGTTYAWTVVQSGVTGASPGGGGTISQTLNTTVAAPGTATYTVTPTAVGCVGATISPIVNVNPRPSTVVPSSFSVCNGATTAGSSFISNPGGGTFNWTNSNPAIGLSSSGIGNVPSFTGTNSGSSPISGTISVTSTLAGCAGTPNNYNITVNPTPSATSTPGAQTICSGITTSFSLTSTVGGTSFNWTSAGAGVSGHSAGSGTAINQTLTNSGTTPSNAVYTITPTAAGCVGTNITATATVNPLPVITATPSSQTICSGSNAPISWSSNLAGTSFSWTSSQTNTSGATASGATSSVSDVLTATTSSAGTTAYFVTPVAAGCTGTAIFPFVTVTPTPDATFSYSTSTACQSGGNIIPTVTGGSSGVFSATPAGLVFVSTATGEIDVAASAVGSYTVTNTVSASGGCPGTSSNFSVTIVAAPDATYNYVSPACQNSTNILPSFGPGASAGVFSAAPAGLVFVSTATGEIDLTASTPGAYSITNFIAASGGCPSTSSNSGFSIDPYLDPTITPIAPVCITSSSFNLVAASAGGTWTGAGITSSTLGTFDPAVAGLGTFLITYSTPAPCSNTDTIFVTVANTEIYGHVTYTGGNIDSGTNTAVLFNYTPAFISFDTAQVSSIDAAGYYHFTSILPGDYLIKIFADTMVYPTVVPTYYGPHFLWDSAMVMTHGCLNDTADVIMVEGVTGVGPGMLSGSVSQGPGFVRVPGDPVPGIDVKLGRNPGGHMMLNTQTNSSGNYSFSGVPANAPGEYYTIYVDIPGLERDSVYNITVTASSYIFSMLDYGADTNSVYPIYPTSVSVGQLKEEVQFIIYPNPTNTNTTIAYTLKTTANVKLEVFDVMGKKVESLVNTDQSAGNYKVNLNKLEAGIYFINLGINDQSKTIRLVVID